MVREKMLSLVLRVLRPLVFSHAFLLLIVAIGLYLQTRLHRMDNEIMMHNVQSFVLNALERTRRERDAQLAAELCELRAMRDMREMRDMRHQQPHGPSCVGASAAAEEDEQEDSSEEDEYIRSLFHKLHTDDDGKAGQPGSPPSHPQHQQEHRTADDDGRGQPHAHATAEAEARERLREELANATCDALKADTEESQAGGTTEEAQSASTDPSKSAIPKHTAPEGTDATKQDPDLAKCKITELRKLATLAGVDAKGSKEALVARIAGANANVASKNVSAD